MPHSERIQAATAVLRTWGPKGLVRRATHELGRRSGHLQRREDRLLGRSYASVSLRLPGLLVGESAVRSWDEEVLLYGALAVPVPAGPTWHAHPLSEHRFEPSQHWSSFSDADPAAGDIKDIWDLGRLTWLLPRALSPEDQVRQQALATVRDWVGANPAYRGPHWMCAQETSLRGIVLLLVADALRDDLSAEDRACIAEVLARSIDRVRLTLRYAMSQRNNHAISEAGFLWGASVLVDHPDAGRFRRTAVRALEEAIADQFMPDGSYAQHSPTYQRLALHVLLWCLRVGEVSGVEPPPATREAVSRSLDFLQAIAAPGSDGRMPNLGGNDGALLFDIAECDIRDFRPLLVHASAVLGLQSPYPSGPWDQEALAFGCEVTHAPSLSAPAIARETVHPLTEGPVHVVLRAGRLRHRPAHADQLHLDVWMDGRPVAVGPGSYRYTAPEPWGNALAGEEVHNLPARPGVPQAVRAGRFFWKRWSDAEIVFRSEVEPMILSRLDLPDGTSVVRFVAISEERVLVIDQSSAAVLVRWNLPAGAQVEHADGRGRLVGEGWQGDAAGAPGWVLPEAVDDDPTSGWHAPTYGIREPLRAVVIPSDAKHRVVTTFARPTSSDASPLIERCQSVDLHALTAARARQLYEDVLR